MSGVDLHRSINTDRHAKSLWFEKIYLRPEQTNGIKTIKKEF